jgi:hypothetical protein
MADKETKQVPGLEPGVVPQDAEAKRYASPPTSLPDAPRTAGYGGADIAKLLERVAALEGNRPEADATREVEEQAKRTKEREEQRAKEQAEHLKQLATYKAKGRPGEAAGEIPSEAKGMGRRLVMAGETFRYAGIPGLWMEPVDGLAKERVKKEAERREAIAKEAADNRFRSADLQRQKDEHERAARIREQRVAEAGDTRQGAGG